MLERVLVVHNAYQQRGGEDSVVDAEIELLEARGHEVRRYGRSNFDVEGQARAALLLQTLWSSRTTSEIQVEIGAFRPDVIHVHNTFPLVSPSVYWAAHRANVPVVQTLHNFRLLCPQAMLLRNSRVCEDCVGAFPLKGISRGCYRGSRVQTAALAGMLGLHRSIGTYRHRVDRYIALNAFCRNKFIEGGLPAERIAIKANFVDLPPPADALRSGGVFVGRLSEEKGVATLADAMRLSGTTLSIIGKGPLEAGLAAVPGARMLGWCAPDAVYGHLSGAQFLVMPSIWYENFPRTLVEAFACGTAVIASRLGAMAELVRDGVTGLLFEPGDSADLASKLRWAHDNPDAMLAMGRNARAEYEANYTPDQNYRQLMDIYAQAVGDKKRS